MIQKVELLPTAGWTSNHFIIAVDQILIVLGFRLLCLPTTSSIHIIAVHISILSWRWCNG